MKTALILTLGSRDIQLKTGSKEKLLETVPSLFFNNNLIPRKFGEFLLKDKNYEIYKQELDYPIVKPAIDFVLNRVDKINQIIFIATDQRRNVGEKFYNNDSVHFAEILKNKIAEDYSNINQNTIKIIKISKDVTYLDKMYNNISELYLKKPLSEITSSDWVYLSNQGGIDAINNAIMFTTLAKIEDKLTILATNEKNKKSEELSFTFQYLNQIKLKKADSYLKTYNYAAIKDLNISEEVNAWCNFAYHRYNFDKTKCYEYLRNYRISFFEQDYTRLVSQIDEWNTDIGLIKELFYNAKIKFQQKAYVDFLLRFFRIVESIALENLQKHITFQFNYMKWDKDIIVFLQRNGDLKEYLEEYTLEYGSKLNYTKAVIPVYIAIIQFYNKKIGDLLNKLRSLADLRNKSIGAHDFQPVSLDKIETELANKDYSTAKLFQDIETYFEITSNPFDEINKKIISLL